jgi:RHS repeat-associated protein
MVQVQASGTTLASYAVNGLGQRVQKVVGATTTRFVYDEQGRLLGEYDGAGKLIQETVWLDDLPVATLRPTGNNGTPTPINVYYVHADHLGGPRAVTRPSDNSIMWRWDNVDPFGANAPNENPAGQGSFSYALRFPGQYYDAETGTHYNYFRDYDPAIGRYIQTDPIGLVGGLNQYQYVKASPTRLVDRFGLMGSRGNPHAFDGCGPNGQLLEWLIPDSPLGFTFLSCCDKHDECYGDCKARPPKEQCDQSFRTCLVSICTRYARGQRLQCEFLANAYFDAVRDHGYSAFNSSRLSCPNNVCQ